MQAGPQWRRDRYVTRLRRGLGVSLPKQQRAAQGVHSVRPNAACERG